MDALQNLRPRVTGVILALGWFYLATNPDAKARQWWWLPAAGLALWLVNLLLLLFAPPDGEGPRRMPGILRNLTARLLDPLVAVLVVYAAVSFAPQLPPVEMRSLLTGCLALLSLAFTFLLFLYAARDGQPMEIRAHWGGLGGGLGGWRVSMPLICLAAAISFGVMATVVNLPAQAPQSGTGEQKKTVAQSVPPPGAAVSR